MSSAQRVSTAASAQHSAWYTLVDVHYQWLPRVLSNTTPRNPFLTTFCSVQVITLINFHQVLVSLSVNEELSPCRTA